MTSKKKVLILGSTGSIGTQTLDVIERHPDLFEVVGLACGKRSNDMLAQAKRFDVHQFVIGDPDACPDAVDELKKIAAEYSDGFYAEGTAGAIELIGHSEADIVVNSLVGSQGLRASLATLSSGKRLALANKESLVVGGDLIMPMVHGADAGWAHADSQGNDLFRPDGVMVPIDSEHGAIFQCLLGERYSEIETLWVTASGGPFRGRSRSELKDVNAAEALAHPTWNMGPKITIDSSTLMNKGLEVIEAHQLFDMPYDQIKVVVQPQSVIHSMVEFSDASVKAHLGTTDMRIPIQFTLSYPERLDAPVKPLDFRTLGSLDFDAPDIETFKCLSLAYDAGKIGGTMPCAMNAANEIAVDLFLKGECGYLDIADCIEHVMHSHHSSQVETVDQLEEVDRMSRSIARDFLLP